MEKNLIKPNFRANNQYRHFDEKAFKRLFFIKHYHDLGMSLKEIETLIALEQNPKQNCHNINEVIDLHIGHIANKIKALEPVRAQLAELK